MASPSSSFSTPESRRRSSPRALPTLTVQQGMEQPGAKAVLPTDEAQATREGAAAALTGVKKEAYFPSGASKPTALQKASRMSI